MLFSVEATPPRHVRAKSLRLKKKSKSGKKELKGGKKQKMEKMRFETAKNKIRIWVKSQESLVKKMQLKKIKAEISKYI